MFYKYRYIFYIIIGSPFLFGLLLIIGLIFNSESSIEQDKNLVKINDVFSKNENSVYAQVPSNGYYKLNGVITNEFKTFQDDNFENMHIGKDSKNVFSGNLILEDLNPNSIIAIGNNYYTDGKVTYYSSSNSERNENVGTLQELFQLMTYNFSLSSKPQIYWYPFVRLPDNLNLKSLDGYGLATTMDKVYFKGEEMPKANPKKTRPFVKSDSRKSFSYFTDEIHIYYNNQLIDLPFNSSINIPEIDGDIPSRNEYLIDSQKGQVVVDGHLFPKENAPYKILSENLKHAYHVLFTSKEGLFYYDVQKQKIEKFADNPFQNNDFKVIYNDVISSANQIYFLSASENWSRNSGLNSRNTQLNLLENVATTDLIRIDNNQTNIGSFWKAKNRYFFFDNLGSSQFSDYSIYEFINAEDAIALAQQSDINYETIERLKEQEKLFIPKYENIATAKTKYDFSGSKFFYKIFGVSIVLLFLLSFIFRNKIFEPYLFENEYLIPNSIIVKKYKISSIEKVEFYLKYDVGKLLVTKFRIISKDGKINKWHGYLRTLSLINPANANIDDYLEILQKELEQKGIKSSIEVINKPN